ncbi:MAG: hypothetical protein JOZ75_12090 [Candidatus Dormibacteraeota bacterium]|nr:hypothetical protein [Candidatus Dormibacteraeota bacterium]
MIGRLAGFFSILAGALVAAGAFANWVTLNSNGTSTSYSGFTIIGDHRDAIVSFGLAAALLFAGFVLSVRPVLAARLLGALAGIGAAIWAGLLFFSLAPQAHALIAPSGPSTSTTIEIGLWITAGGGLLGLLTAFAAAAARQRRVVVAPAPAAEAPRRSATMGPAPEPGSPPAPARTTDAPARTPVAPAPTPTPAGRR